MIVLRDPPKKCQVCHREIEDVVIDGQLRQGQWGYMCPSCHKNHGVGLGVGLGQKYQKQADGTFVKVEG